MELKINQIILHLLDPGASEPLLSDRPMDLDADLFDYFTTVLERAFATAGFCRIPPLRRRWRTTRILWTFPAGSRG